VTAPAVSVVVASHERPARLRRLLDALDAQTLRGFELIVVLDDAGEESAALLGERGVRFERLAPGSAGPGAKRNTGWRAARAPLVAFTDDDCRPAPEWLEGLVAAARDGAVVQGATRPDPEEAHRLGGPLARTQHIDPPSPFGQTCNIAYPRALLEALGGFPELPDAAGEDTDLFLRARARGAPLVAAPGAVVWHAVTQPGLGAALRGLWRWQHVAYVVRRHPSVRRHLTLGVFWKPSHLWLAVALLGRRPVAWLPYLWHVRRRLPVAPVVDLAELVVALRGAVRYRTPFL
jgi:GT2 family glycosyltransferase